MNLPPLKSLWYFKHAAELGSFKLAAEQLFVSQAAVSQQIRLLEAHLGCQLFTRQTRFVALTRAGEQLLPAILQGFSHFQSGVNGLSQDTEPHSLNLSVLPSFASGWLLCSILVIFNAITLIFIYALIRATNMPTLRLGK